MAASNLRAAIRVSPGRGSRLRVKSISRECVILAQRSAEKRLCKLLLHLAKANIGLAEDEADEVTIALSHDQLARFAAMSRQRVTITMENFRRRGVLRYKRGHPPAVNINALGSYLEEIS
jgi:CRP-like cAMP-binding protein